MKRWNLFAASLIAATFVLLALSPLTRDALRFDIRASAGKPVLSGVLVDLGIRQDSLPFNGFGPALRATNPSALAASPELPVRLATAAQLPGKEKWAALQQLVADFPDSPAAHAVLLRMACKNGGSVGVGHDVEQAELYAEKAEPRTGTQGDPRDAATMLRSCETGERLDPDNAYFPAMAAIAYLAMDRDDDARAALRRAAAKPFWREYIDVEAAGQVRRAEILYGPQNSLSESAILASILFPHYAALRSLARVMTARAMYAEQSGDIATGLALRKDTARLGEKMREQSSSLIGGLVGMAMVRVAEQRPGGAPAIKSRTEDTKESQSRTDRQFLAYLEAHGTPGDAAHWQRYLDAAAESRAIANRGMNLSTFSSPTLFQTQWRLMANLALLGGVTLLCSLAAFALLRPWLGQHTGRVGSALVLTVFVATLLWMSWQAVGNLRNILALSNLIQGLSGDGSTDPAMAQAQYEILFRTLRMEAAIGLGALLLPAAYLVAVAFLASRPHRTMGLYLRQWTLPLAALLTVGYALHLTVFALGERTIHAELQEVIAHEGRHIAAKMGKVWPATPRE